MRTTLDHLPTGIGANHSLLSLTVSRNVTFLLRALAPSEFQHQAATGVTAHPEP
jgi:hypothetical protein